MTATELREQLFQVFRDLSPKQQEFILERAETLLSIKDEDVEAHEAFHAESLQMIQEAARDE